MLCGLSMENNYSYTILLNINANLASVLLLDTYRVLFLGDLELAYRSGLRNHASGPSHEIAVLYCVLALDSAAAADTPRDLLLDMLARHFSIPLTEGDRMSMI